MVKRASLFLGSFLAAVTTLFGQISSFFETPLADSQVSDVTDDLHVHIEDIDGDGFDEVIMYDNDLSTLRYYSNDGTGTLTLESASNNILSDAVFAGSLETGDTKRLEFADVDNDGDMDLAIFSQKYYNDGSVLLFANDGNQLFTEFADYMEISGSLSNGQFTDIDDDGDQDLVNSNYIYNEDDKIWNAYNQVAIFDDVTMDFQPFVPFTQVTPANINFIDIDEDDDEDAFTAAFTQIEWQEKTAATTYSTATASIVPEMQLAQTILKIAVGDLDNDGALDMILFDNSASQMRHYEQTCFEPPGTVCDDGDDCTLDDALDADCNCTGDLSPDTDMDGLCDAIDDTNGDCSLGDPCDDGDDCTLDDALDENCDCVGIESPDTDMDGICDAIDDTNGDCILGDVCDDGDDCSLEDALDENCDCVGVQSPDTDMDGICDALDDTNGDCTLGTLCDDGEACTTNDALDENCDCVGEAINDSDGDGICDELDETNGDCTLNAPCDDGDDCTVDDVFDENCNCVGVESPDTDMDGICDAIDETNGDCTLGEACDDGDDCTVDDALNADCECIGVQSPDTDMDGICDEIDETNGDCTLGEACDDGDECTTDDALDENCDCVGIESPDTDMDGICDAIDLTNGDCILGEICNDSDSCTVDDAMDANCECVGIFQDSDNDTVCDADDVCPGMDDTIDDNNDGIPDCLVGLEELLAKHFMIYPNPNDGSFNVETDLLIQEILIMNALGQQIPIEYGLGSSRVDLSSYSSGVYHLQIRTEQGILRKKIVVQK